MRGNRYEKEEKEKKITETVVSTTSRLRIPGKKRKSQIFGIVRVLEQVVSGKFFVLVAGKVGLDHQIPREAKMAKLKIKSQFPVRADSQ